MICSYHFASAKKDEINRIPWDLVVIDEAHRLRNIYKTSSVLAKNIANALGSVPKLLLTATPLQNSLMELYGLVSVIDNHVFGDAFSFREQFIRTVNERSRNINLQERLRPICIRTLRKQVVEYIPFTNRVLITQDFMPSDEEHHLYALISIYLQRDSLIALPASQRTLITLILRKLLASSTFAIAGTLRRLVSRLEDLSQELELLDDEDIDGIDELEDEWETENDTERVTLEIVLKKSRFIDPELLKEELAELRHFAELAENITVNAKGEALGPALDVAFERTKELGAQRKAVIFTESRRTQQYLFNLLSANGYKNDLVMMNGSNNDDKSKEIYEAWLEKHKGQDIITGSRAVNIKTAIVEYFKEQASILISTEAGAEGINLQFCSLVVNYDLPWNPQRIEQRIGRCHRYGQKHDVVVVNFINRRNAADQRVHQLLREKFKLFDGVFGVSDEVLGAIESGVDIEKRIALVYQNCRTEEEIIAAFDSLQAELDEQIQSRMAYTRRSLLEHIDAEVSARLKVNQDQTLESLSQREQWLMGLTRVELDGQAQFDPDRPRFNYTGTDAYQGWYHFNWKEAEKNSDIFYRQDHPLAVSIIQKAISRDLTTARLIFDYSAYDSKVSVLEPLIGSSGWLELSKLTVEALDVDEFLVFAARTDSGQVLDDDICRKLMLLPATIEACSEAELDLSSVREKEVKSRVEQVDIRNGKFFDEEVIKLDYWSDDLKKGLEREIKEIDKEIREARKIAALAASLSDKLKAQKQIKALESKRNKKRRELFDAQDNIDAQRDELIAKIEKQLKQRHSIEQVFLTRWRLI